MAFSPQHVAAFSGGMRRAAVHLIMGRDSNFIDSLEEVLFEAKSAYKETENMDKTTKDNKMVGQLVLVRTYSAGVHIGTLVRQDGREVELGDAYRLWSWRGAFTLSNVSQKGVASGSRVAGPVPTILLTEAIEIMPVSDVARPSLTTATEK